MDEVDTRSDMSEILRIACMRDDSTLGGLHFSTATKVIEEVAAVLAAAGYQKMNVMDAPSSQAEIAERRREINEERRRGPRVMPFSDQEKGDLLRIIICEHCKNTMGYAACLHRSHKYYKEDILQHPLIKRVYYAARQAAIDEILKDAEENWPEVGGGGYVPAKNTYIARLMETCDRVAWSDADI